MQYCIPRRKEMEYCAKYATKTESRSEPLKLVYKNIVQHLTGTVNQEIFVVEIFS